MKKTPLFISRSLFFVFSTPHKHEQCVNGRFCGHSDVRNAPCNCDSSAVKTGFFPGFSFSSDFRLMCAGIIIAGVLVRRRPQGWLNMKITDFIAFYWCAIRAASVGNISRIPAWQCGVRYSMKYEFPSREWL